MTLRCVIEVDPCAHALTDDYPHNEEGYGCPAGPPQT